MRNIKISEEQHRLIKEMISEDINEMLNPNANAIQISQTDNAGKKKSIPQVFNDVTKKVLNTASDADKITTDGSLPGVSGGVEGSFTVSKKNHNKNTVSESYLVSKKQVRSMQLRKLKENSTVIKRKDFIE